MEIEKDGHGIRPSTPRPPMPAPKPLYVDSASDARTINNVLRHEYRKLTEAEKQRMQAIKDKGAQFLALLEILEASREVEIAKTKLEEAVMWAVKHVTK